MAVSYGVRYSEIVHRGQVCYDDLDEPACFGGFSYESACGLYYLMEAYLDNWPKEKIEEWTALVYEMTGGLSPKVEDCNIVDGSAGYVLYADGILKINKVFLAVLTLLRLPMHHGIFGVKFMDFCKTLPEDVDKFKMFMMVCAVHSADDSNACAWKHDYGKMSTVDSVGYSGHGWYFGHTFCGVLPSWTDFTQMMVVDALLHGTKCGENFIRGTLNISTAIQTAGKTTNPKFAVRGCSDMGALFDYVLTNNEARSYVARD